MMRGAPKPGQAMHRALTIAAWAVCATLLGVAVFADAIAARPGAAPPASWLPLLVHGARSTVVVATIATGISLLVGVPIGAAAGLGSRGWDRVLTRAVEMLAAFPAVIVVAVVCAFEPEPTLPTLGIAIALVRVSEVARLVRMEALRWHASESFLSARAIGASAPGMVVRHLGPQLAAPLAQTAVSSVSAVVFLETLLVFLGLGASNANPSWGGALAQAVSSGDGWKAAAFLAATLATVGAMQIVAERTRERFDPYAGRATPCAPRA